MARGSDAKKGFEPGLESLRGIAALSVAVAHSLNVYDDAHAVSRTIAFVLPPQGGVLLFFVLSGYVLGRSLERGSSYTEFLIRRACRILPMMWLSLILMLVLKQSLTVNAQDVTRFGSFVLSIPKWSDLLSNSLLISTNINPVTWTLIPEIFGAALLPLLVWLHHRLKTGWQIGLFFAVVFVSIGAHKLFREQAFWASCFYYGFVLPPLIAKLKLSDKSLRVIGGVGALMMMIGTYLWVPYSAPMRYTVVAGSILLIGAVANKADAFGWLQNGALRFLGRVSYSFYLLHFAAMYIGIALLNLAPGFSGIVAGLALVTLSVPIALAMSAVTYRFIEAPSIIFGKTSSLRFRIA